MRRRDGTRRLEVQAAANVHLDHVNAYRPGNSSQSIRAGLVGPGRDTDKKAGVDSQHVAAIESRRSLKTPKITHRQNAEDLVELTPPRWCTGTRENREVMGEHDNAILNEGTIRIVHVSGERFDPANVFNQTLGVGQMLSPRGIHIEEKGSVGAFTVSK